MLSTVVLGGTGRASTLSFVIDPSQSYIDLAGRATLGALGDVGLRGQGGIPMHTALSGAVVANTDLATQISFPGGSSVLPAISGDWEPMVGGGAGTEPAQFGALAHVTDRGDGFYAFRGTTFDVTSPVVPLAGGNFDGGQLLFGLSGNVDYRFSGPSIPNDFGTSVVTNDVQHNTFLGESLYVAGNTATLVIRFVAGPYDILVGNEHLTAQFSGGIVATAIVPEPSALALFSSGLGLMVTIGLHRRRGSCATA